MVSQTVTNFTFRLTSEAAILPANRPVLSVWKSEKERALPTLMSVMLMDRVKDVSPAALNPNINDKVIKDRHFLSGTARTSIMTLS